jgi:hypothetical protein
MRTLTTVNYDCKHLKYRPQAKGRPKSEYLVYEMISTNTQSSLKSFYRGSLMRMMTAAKRFGLYSAFLA